MKLVSAWLRIPFWQRVVAGFVLYVVIEVARSLGREGLVSPVLAAWAPSIVAILLGSTVLLFREDG